MNQLFPHMGQSTERAPWHEIVVGLLSSIFLFRPHGVAAIPSSQHSNAYNSALMRKTGTGQYRIIQQR